jgi:hypothetical protein
MPRLIRGLTMIAVVLVACDAPGEGDVPVDAATVDSAGVRIIDNGQLPPSDPTSPPAPLVTIGVVDGLPENQLFRVSDAKRLSDGAIAVTNGGTRELHIYESDGTHRATAGGEGQGPNEFRYPIAMVILPGDTIQVQDRMDRVYFTSDGEFLRRETADRQAFVELAQAAGGMSEGGQWMADGTYFAPIYQGEREDRPPVAGPPFRPPMSIVRASADFTSLDSLGRFGGILQQYVAVGRERPSATVPPFGTNTSWALGSSDGTIVLGDNATSQVERFHPDGTHSIVRWSHEAEPITGAEAEAWKDRQRSASWAQGRLPELERAWAGLDLPTNKPFYGRTMVGSDGTLWLGANDNLGQTTTLTVFNRDGSYEGSVQIAGEFVVYDSGPGWVLGMSRDENEVEFIHVYER